MSAYQFINPEIRAQTTPRTQFVLDQIDATLSAFVDLMKESGENLPSVDAEVLSIMPIEIAATMLVFMGAAGVASFGPASSRNNFIDGSGRELKRSLRAKMAEIANARIHARAADAPGRKPS